MPSSGTPIAAVVTITTTIIIATGAITATWSTRRSTNTRDRRFAIEPPYVLGNETVLLVVGDTSQLEQVGGQIGGIEGAFGSV